MSGSLPAFVARRLALLVLTMVLVPSLSFVLFTLIQGDHTAPLDVLGELVSYLAAVFLQGDVGEGPVGAVVSAQAAAACSAQSRYRRQ